MKQSNAFSSLDRRLIKWEMSQIKDLEAIEAERKIAMKIPRLLN